MKRFFFFQPVCTFTVTLILFQSTDCLAQGVGVYAPSLGAGDAVSIATAFSGVSQGNGLAGGRKNPAAYHTDRNELLIEGEMWDGLAIQSGIRSPGARFGTGEIGYLIKAEYGTFVIAHVPRSHIHASGGPYGDSDAKVRLGYNDLEAAYSVKRGSLGVFGFAFRWIRGEYATGNLFHGISDLETIYRPSLFETVLGYRGRKGMAAWGVVIESPAFGSFTKGVDATVGGSRDWTNHTFDGAWGVKAGAGITGNRYWLDSDITVRPAGNVSDESTTLDGSGMILEMGFASKVQLGLKTSLYSGLRFRIGDKDAGNSLMPGLGATYLVTPDLTLLAGAGMLIPFAGGYDETTLEDLFPFSLRIGILYHGE